MIERGTSRDPIPTPPVAQRLSARVARRFIRAPRADGLQVHGSTLARDPRSGRWVAAWFCGLGEGTADTHLEWSRESANGSFGPPRIVVTPQGVPCWNPVLAVDPSGDLVLFGRVGAQISSWTTWISTFARDGSLNIPRPLTDVASGEPDAGPVKNPPLLLPTGRWLAGGSTEVWSPDLRWDAHVDILSTDRATPFDGRATKESRPHPPDGRATDFDDPFVSSVAQDRRVRNESRSRHPDTSLHWHRRPIPVDHTMLTGAGIIQPTLVAVDDRVVALLRSTEGVVFRSESRDDGETWSSAVPIALPNNNSGICAAALHDGRIVLAHNPVAGSWGVRCPLVLSVSDDAGVSWQQRVVIEDGRTPLDGERPSLPRPGGFDAHDTGVLTDGVGEYSYPTVVVNGDQVLVSYTWQRRAIALATVGVDAL